MLDVASFSDQPRLVMAATTCGFQTASADAAGAAVAGGGAVRHQLAGQFQHDPAGDLGADAGDLGEGLAVARVGGDADRFGLVDGQDRQREPGSDAADAEQDVEDLAFVVAAETEQGERVLPHDQGREELPLLARRGGC